MLRRFHPLFKFFKNGISKKRFGRKVSTKPKNTADHDRYYLDYHHSDSDASSMCSTTSLWSSETVTQTDRGYYSSEVDDDIFQPSPGRDHENMVQASRKPIVNATASGVILDTSKKCKSGTSVARDRRHHNLPSIKDVFKRLKIDRKSGRVQSEKTVDMNRVARLSDVQQKEIVADPDGEHLQLIGNTCTEGSECSKGRSPNNLRRRPSGRWSSLGPSISSIHGTMSKSVRDSLSVCRSIIAEMKENDAELHNVVIEAKNLAENFTRMHQQYAFTGEKAARQSVSYAETTDIDIFLNHLAHLDSGDVNVEALNVRSNFTDIVDAPLLTCSQEKFKKLD